MIIYLVVLCMRLWKVRSGAFTQLSVAWPHFTAVLQAFSLLLPHMEKIDTQGNLTFV